MSGSLTEQVAALFDAVADEYDNTGVEFFKPIAHGLVAELGPKPGERALDVGCGRGAALFPIARAVGPTGSAVGIDVSRRMVAAAAADAARLGLDVDVRVGDAMAPDFPAESFDLVASSLVLFFLPDPLAALQAWRTLLVGAGRVGIATFGPYGERWAEHVDPVWRKYGPPEPASDPRPSGGESPFASDAGMEKLFTDAGYRDVRTVTATIPLRFDDAEHWYRWSRSAGQRRFWQAIPDENLETVKAEAFAAVEQCRDEQGRVGTDQQVRYTLAVR